MDFSTPSVIQKRYIECVSKYITAVRESAPPLVKRTVADAHSFVNYIRLSTMHNYVRLKYQSYI